MPRTIPQIIDDMIATLERLRDEAQKGRGFNQSLHLESILEGFDADRKQITERLELTDDEEGTP